MAILDTIDIIATDAYKQWVLNDVFRYTGAYEESTTEMELTVVTSGPSVDPINVKFRSSFGTVFIHGYDIVIQAGTRVIGFEFREIGETNLTASVTLTGAEHKVFDEAGILYIDEIRFRLDVSFLKG